MKRALVVGGSGFIGLNLVDELLSRGVAVRVTRRKQTPTVFLRRRPVELVDACLDEPGPLAAAMQGCDTVFLAGAYYPRYSVDLAASLDAGVTGVRNACAAACSASVERFVYTSSVGSLAAAPQGRPADERDVPARMPEDSVYRAVKWAMEREVDAAVARGLPAVTLLPGGCLGPWDVRVGTGAFLVGVVRGALPWWVTGLVNMVDVGDVVRAHVAAAMHPRPSPRYCVAGHTVQVGWLLDHVAARYGGSAPRTRLGPTEARARADEDERSACARSARVPLPRELVDIVLSGQPVSSALAERELGVETTPLDDALDRAYAWFRRYGYVPRNKEQGSDESRETDP